MPYLLTARHREPGDNELFPLIRIWIKEVLVPRGEFLKSHPIDIVFGDWKFALMRKSCPQDFARWAEKALEYQKLKEITDG